jgi:hypothetical protein
LRRIEGRPEEIDHPSNLQTPYLPRALGEERREPVERETGIHPGPDDRDVVLLAECVERVGLLLVR